VAGIRELEGGTVSGGKFTITSNIGVFSYGVRYGFEKVSGGIFMVNGKRIYPGAGQTPTQVEKSTPAALISEAGDYVLVDYTGTMADGQVFDSSIGYESFGFVLGSGTMIPGFDAAAHGMAVGETKTVTILSDDAYGKWTEELILTIPRDIATEEEEPPVAGEVIYLVGGMGSVPVTVLEVTDETLVVDANHQLVGEDLTFEITMVQIVKSEGTEGNG
jgi:peptidylprolyl isomerase